MRPKLRLRGSALVASLFLSTLSLSVRAEETGTPPKTTVATARVGFSNLVVKSQKSTSVTIADEGAKLLILERLRRNGVTTVGGESLVFGDDRTASAEFVLGGTVSELECFAMLWPKPKFGCRARVDWEVLEAQTNKVVYRHASWAGVRNKVPGENEAAARELLEGAADELAKRPLFRELIAGDRKVTNEASALSDETLAACAKVFAMPKEAEGALDALAVIEVADGHGSGFLVSSSPFVLTAAHVVADAKKVTVKFRNGVSSAATVVRLDRDADVALLRLKEEVSLPGCLSLSEALPTVGANVYAMGTPMSRELGFSLSRGIVSGIRQVDSISLIQTDASVSPGMSGGPLVDDSGRAFGIVSKKIVGGGSEGVAFGVPVAGALSAIHVRLGSATSEALSTEKVKRSKKEEAVVDPTSTMPEVDPAREAELRDEIRSAEKSRITPWYIPTMRWGGLAAGVAGTGLAVYSGLKNEQSWTRSEYESNRLLNDVGFIVAGVGVASFILSFPLAPSVAEDFDDTPPEYKTTSKVSLELLLNELHVKGEF